MPKITLDDLTNLQNETSAVNTINNNSAAIEAAIENTLSRDGTSPNEMNANLDMNNYRVFNLPAATSPTEPIRKAEFDNLTADISNAGQYAQEAKDARDAAQVAEAGALEAETFAYLWASENEDTPVDDGIRTGYSSFHWSAKSEDHATDSENAKVEAQTARDFAHAWATEAEDVPVDDGVNPPGFSAYHWAQKAEEVVLGSIDASAIDYDNAVSGLTATNVQDAIDETNGLFFPKTGGALTGNLAVGGELTYGKAKIINNTDLNALTVPGFYDGAALINAPNGSSDWFYVEVQRHSQSNNYVHQRATALNHSGYATWVRNRTAGVWQPWRQVWDSGNLDLDPWAMQPIGVPIPVFGHITGVSAPPTNKGYRYVNLTAGLTGSGQYNEGILANETVTGSAPLITATADIDLPTSPMHGQTIHLIGTERRFIRAGSVGTVQDDAVQDHTHSQTRDNQYGSGASGAVNFFWSSTAGSTGGMNSGRAANETRPRNIGATYFMRIL